MVYIVFTTTGDVAEAKEIGKDLVTHRLAACVNILPEVESIYRWEGEVEESSEVLMLIKTTEGRLEEVKSVIKRSHSYEVPEILAVEVDDGLEDYLEWVTENCQDKSEPTH